MKTADFDYYLPKELIAQSPIKNREKSRLLVLDKKTGKIKHKHFYEIIDFLNAGDCLIINDTRVLKARLLGRRKTSGKAEVLLLKRINESKDSQEWEALVKPGSRLNNGEIVSFDNPSFNIEIGERLEDGKRVVCLHGNSISEEIRKVGRVPLPPYIKNELQDDNRYQTVYFDADKETSAAAPTAGLHFTSELLQKIIDKGIKVAKVSLDVGLDTFRPVSTDNVEDHKIHSENISLSEETAKIINKTKENGGKVFAVGTTSVRTIESCTKNNKVKPYSGTTNLYIYPGYKFKTVDSLITNFHFPRSTLIMLVSAFGGYENIMKAYKQAIEKRYRFYSFGDAMLII